MLEPLTVVHRFDQRGCGGSDPSRQHAIARQVADIEVLRRRWRHDAWIVMGHSFGATLAFSYAVAHPDRTVAMGYLNGVGAGDWRSPYQEERLRRMTDEQQKRLAELKARPARPQAEEVEFRALSWFTDFADPVQGWDRALGDAQLDMAIDFEANNLLNAETDGWSATEVLAQARPLNMPCRLIHGQRDPRPSGTLANLANVIPHAQMHIVEDAGDKPRRERPDELQELLSRLIASMSG